MADTELHPSSPQAAEMADESMVRNLAAQAEALWPMELPLLGRYGEPREILDLGCGTGEISERLLEQWPQARLTGIDLERPHLDRAASRCARFANRSQFLYGDAMDLDLPGDRFDLVVCRHLLQAVPSAPHVLDQIRRVLRPGGWAHLIAEDYGMLWCHPVALNPDSFWQVLPYRYEAAVGCDLHVGRKMFAHLTTLGMDSIAVDYLVADTLRVPRETFARIWEAWRDGYSEALSRYGEMPRAEVDRRWTEMIAAVRDPQGYALWQVPLWTARKPSV